MTESNTIEEAVTILEDGTDEEQATALEALKKISHEYPGDLAPYLTDICQFASDENQSIRYNVAIILRNTATHDPSAVVPHAETVRTLLTDDDPFVLAFAMAVTEAITRESAPALSGVTDRLSELLTYENFGASDPARDTRVMAAAALGNLGESDSTIAAQADTPLAERLDDPEPEVRATTIMAITKLGIAHPETVSTALSCLPKRLDDDDPSVRQRTILAYTLFRHQQTDAISKPGTVAPALKRAIERTDLDSEEAKRAAETHRHIEDMAANGD